MLYFILGDVFFFFFFRPNAHNVRSCMCWKCWICSPPTLLLFLSPFERYDGIEQNCRHARATLFRWNSFRQSKFSGRWRGIKISCSRAIVVCAHRAANKNNIASFVFGVFLFFFWIRNIKFYRNIKIANWICSSGRTAGSVLSRRIDFRANKTTALVSNVKYLSFGATGVT